MINRKYFAYALAAIFFLLLILVFQLNCNQKEIPAPNVPKPEVIEKQVEVESKKSLQKIDSLEKANDSLENKLFVEKLNYSSHKRSALVTQAELRQRINYLDSSNKSNVVKITAEDYFTSIDDVISSCDSMIATYELTLNNKDSIIAQRDTLYGVLRRGFEKSINANKELFIYSNKLKKELKKKRTGNMLWKGIAIAAGLVLLNNATK